MEMKEGINACNMQVGYMVCTDDALYHLVTFNLFLRDPICFVGLVDFFWLKNLAKLMKMPKYFNSIFKSKILFQPIGL